MGFLISLAKNGVLRPSHSYKAILEEREEREQLVICCSAFWKQKRENLKNINLPSMPVSISRIIYHSHSFTRLEIYHHIYFMYHTFDI